MCVCVFVSVSVSVSVCVRVCVGGCGRLGRKCSCPWPSMVRPEQLVTSSQIVWCLSHLSRALHHMPLNLLHVSTWWDLRKLHWWNCPKLSILHRESNVRSRSHEKWGHVAKAETICIGSACDGLRQSLSRAVQARTIGAGM